MITILGSILGFITSFLPTLMQYFTAKQEAQTKIELRKLDIEAAKLGHIYEMEIKSLDADIQETKSIYEHDSSLSGPGFMNAFRASVRPVITYIFFLLFVMVKVSALYLMYDLSGNDLLTWQQIMGGLPHIWDDETSGIFAAIISFWFGSRALTRFRGAKNIAVVPTALKPDQKVI